MIGPLTYLDAGLIAVCFISGLLAMYRGLSREMLAVLSWIAAGLTGLYFWYTQEKLATDMAAQMNVDLLIAKILLVVIASLLVLVVVHLITARISDSILDSQVGMIDRILGFLFGLARGLVLVVIPYMFYLAFYPDESQHFPWVRESKTLPAIKSTGDALRVFLERSIVPLFEGGDRNEQQEGSRYPQGGRFALADGREFHISVTWRDVLDRRG